MKKLKKLNMIIILIIAIIILAILGIYSYTSKINTEKTNLQAEVSDGIQVIPYKLNDGILTVLLKISNQDGILKITDEANNRVLNSYGKTTITMDYKVAYNEDKTYSFIIEKANGETETQNFIVNDQYRDSIISTNVTFRNDNCIFEVEISEENNNKYYYKLSENDDWIEYTGKFDKSVFRLLDDSKINDDETVTLMLKKVYDEKADNTIIISKRLPVQELPELITEINNVADLQRFQYTVNYYGATYTGKTVNLNTDIDLSSVCYSVDGTIENDVSWEPIGIGEGNSNYITFYPLFGGIFEGNNYTISNLYINSDTNFRGLFGQSSGTIQNLKISGNVKSTSGRTSILCGDSSGTISNITTLSGSSIQANGNSGGICGYSTGIISNCQNNATVNATGNHVGGICGLMGSGQIIASANYAKITTSTKCAGGITGAVNEGESKIVVRYCYNKGDITSYSHSGGIVRIFRSI